MNAKRRKKIEKIQNQLLSLQDQLSEIEQEEQDSFDNLPESFQYGERGEEMERCIELLGSAVIQIEELIGELSDI